MYSALGGRSGRTGISSSSREGSSATTYLLQRSHQLQNGRSIRIEQLHQVGGQVPEERSPGSGHGMLSLRHYIRQNAHPDGSICGLLLTKDAIFSKSRAEASLGDLVSPWQCANLLRFNPSCRPRPRIWHHLALSLDRMPFCRKKKRLFKASGSVLRKM